MDVKSAFLNGTLKEEVYVKQPIGFEETNSGTKVLKLKKALYGLKQAPRAWNFRLDACLRKMGFERCPVEHAVYTKKKEENTLIIGVYVDDLIILGSNPRDVDTFKKQMKDSFEMSDLGLQSYYLGIEVNQSQKGITMSQKAYAETILEKMGMIDCKPCKVPMDSRAKLCKDDGSPRVDATLYRSIIGSLRYLVNTRPDLAYSVGLVSRYMEAPNTTHMGAVKQILRYIKGTLNYGCWYKKSDEEEPKLVGYCDSDLAGDVDDRKSTSGVMFFLGKSPVSWTSQKQKVVALSSCEAEYVAGTAGLCQGLWLNTLVQMLMKKEIRGRVILRVDNRSTIALMKNPVFHDRSKHIDVKHHFIRDCIQKKEAEVEFVRTEDQYADVLTKPLPCGRLENMIERIGTGKLESE